MAVNLTPVSYFTNSRKLEAREWRHGTKTTNDPVGRADARPGASARRVAGSQRSGVRLCLAGHVCGDRAQGRGRQAACALPGRADHQPRGRGGTSVRGHGYGVRAVLHGRGHQPDRARRHRVDDLQPALRCRPALCDGGSPVQGPGRLERRDHGPRGRRRDVRHRHAPGSAAALQPGGRISRRRHQALGKLGAGRPRRRQGQRGLCRSQEDPSDPSLRRELLGARASALPPFASGPAGDLPCRVVAGRPGSGRAICRRGVHRPAHHRRCEGVPGGPAAARGSPRPASGFDQDPSGHERRPGRDRSRRPRARRRRSTTR